ncbi:MAG TPA: ABC transporter permease [Spirochaetia bacterium]|nr:ABC transporter permease [Spirochaetia bacterium]
MSGRRISPPRTLARGIPMTVWMLLLVVIPLGYTFVTSFFQVDGLQIAARPTLKNYALFFTDPMYPGILLKSMLISLAIAVIAILAGYPLAYMVSFRVSRGRQVLFMLSIIPLWVSYLVRIIAWRTILGNKGVINSALEAAGIIREPLSFLLYNRFAIAVTLTYICIPFVFIPVYTALEKIPRNLLEASSDLGAGELRTFTSVVLPLSLPGLVTGFIFAFIIALGDYIIPQQLGGTQGIMFGNLIWSQFGFAFNWPFGAALSFILLAITVTILRLTSRFGSTEGGFLGE